ncbi:Hsp20/alpha crystallin family protein [Leisingera daeponensis]|uniref:Hsp20/alpha crystallin family protein n=2 Tax=Leisingera daeponensis TaxID=405746 RepID=A0ABS7NFI0_9RHOB|nr:Hsp20/alpha crystallin family protein [Leisingera daeponensis]MBY6139449.1 Hsp20/alpha crystallin family protein [Leisingera daeponensis]
MLQSTLAPFRALDPFADMRRMQSDMNELFNGYGLAQRPQVYPAVNFWAGQDSIVLTAELPGLSEDDIELTVKDTTAVLRGSYPERASGEDVAWRRRERPSGSFSRTVELPFRVDPDRVDARFRNGVLTVEMQRPEEDKPKRIKIKAS